MKVQYTLPGLDLQTLPELSGGVETERSFRDQMRSPATDMPINWQHELRLDARPMTATYVGPPPRPRSLETGDAQSEGVRWRRLLLRHGGEAAGSTSSTDHQAVSVMLDMLRAGQDAADSVTYQNVAITRG